MSFRTRTLYCFSVLVSIFGTTAFQRHLFGAQAHRIVVDIDKAELAKFGDLPNCDFVHADLRALPAAIASVDSLSSTAAPDWLPWCQTRRREYLAEEAAHGLRQMNVYNITQVFNTCPMTVCDSSLFRHAEETFSRFFAPQRNARFFNGHALGSMGFGLPQSIGAAFGSPPHLLS